MTQEGIDREDYTWPMAYSDLALQTHLTFGEVMAFVRPIEETGLVHPYDALPLLTRIVAQLAVSPGVAGHALSELLNQAGGST